MLKEQQDIMLLEEAANQVGRLWKELLQLAARGELETLVDLPVGFSVRPYAYWEKEVLEVFLRWPFLLVVSPEACRRIELVGHYSQGDFMLGYDLQFGELSEVLPNYGYSHLGKSGASWRTFREDKECKLELTLSHLYVRRVELARLWPQGFKKEELLKFDLGSNGSSTPRDSPTTEGQTLRQGITSDLPLHGNSPRSFLESDKDHESSHAPLPDGTDLKEKSRTIVVRRKRVYIHRDTGEAEAEAEAQVPEEPVAFSSLPQSGLPGAIAKPEDDPLPGLKPTTPAGLEERYASKTWHIHQVPPIAKTPRSSSDRAGKPRRSVEKSTAPAPQRKGEEGVAPAEQEQVALSVSSLPPAVEVSSPALLRVPEVLKLIGISKSKLYDITNPDSSRFDPTFPKRVSLGVRDVAFRQEEIFAWIESLKRKARSLDIPKAG